MVSIKQISDRLFKVIPLITLAGIFAGAILGYMYYSFIGCASGSCAIKSNPYLMTLYGALLGYLIFDMFARKKSKPAAKDSGTES